MSDQDHPAWPTADDDLPSDRPAPTGQTQSLAQPNKTEQSDKPGPATAPHTDHGSPADQQDNAANRQGNAADQQGNAANRQADPVDQTANAGQSDQTSDTPGPAGQTEPVGQADQPWQFDQTDQASEADQATQPDQAEPESAAQISPAEQLVQVWQLDQIDRPEPTQKDHPTDPEQDEQTDRADQDQPNLTAEADQTTQPEQTDPGSQADKTEQPDQVWHLDSADQPDQTGNADQAGVDTQPDQDDQPDRAEHANRGQSDLAEQPDQVWHFDVAGQTGEAGQSDRDIQSGQDDQAGRAGLASEGLSDPAGQSDQVWHIDGAGQSGDAGRDDQVELSGGGTGHAETAGRAGSAGQFDQVWHFDEVERATPSGDTGQDSQGTKSDQDDQAGRALHADSDLAGQSDQVWRIDGAGQTGDTDRDDQVEQPDEAVEAGRAGQTGHADWFDQDDQTGRFEPVERPGPAGQAAAQTAQAEQTNQTNPTGQTGPGGQAGQTGLGGQVGQDSLAGKAEQTVQIDLAVLQADRARRAELAAQGERTAQTKRPEKAGRGERGGDAAQSTQRIQFPPVDPDKLRPAQKTAPIQRPGFPPPEPPRAAPMRIEPGGRPPVRPKVTSLEAEKTVKVAPVRRPERPKVEPPPPPPPRPVKAPPEPPPRPVAKPVDTNTPEPEFLPGLDEDEREPKPRRSRTGLIVAAAIVLVIAVGAGVVFAVPGVKEALGFGEAEPEVVIQPPPAPVAFTPSLRSPSAEAPTPSAQGIQAALAGPASVPALGTLTGTVRDAATGTVLWDKGASTPLVPASTTKILTGGAALLKMDHGQQLSTKVVAGTEPGSVVLVGGGDVTLNSLPVGKKSWYPGAAYLDDLVAQVKANGGKVTQVYVDSTRYTGDGLAPGWLPGDVAAGYMSPTTALMMDGGRADPTKDVSPRSANPPRSVAAEFAKRIGANVAAKPEVTAPADAKVLGEVKSPPLTELVDNAMVASDNVLADAIAREVAKAAGEEPSFNGVSKATLKILQENGFDVSGAQLIDGSGLSTNDKVPARLLAEVLAVAAGDGKDPRTAKLRPLLGGLPVAGGSGTLEGRFAPATPAASGRGWVRAKTGTLLGVNSLAGVVLDTDGRMLAFALMSNGSDSAGARPALDAVAAALRACGCK